MMTRNLLPNERLVVAVDFNCDNFHEDPWYNIERQTLDFCQKLKKTGVIIKLETALPTCSYRLISKVQELGFSVFADMKFHSTAGTLSRHADLINFYKPEIVTVCCDSSVEAMKTLKSRLPRSEVLGVTVTTDQNSGDTKARYSCLLPTAVDRLAKLAFSASLDGLISSPTELKFLRANYGELFTLNTPNIRVGERVEGDDQNPNRSMQPKQAILAGADRIIVGRPIIQSADPYRKVMSIVDEILSAL